MTIQDINRYINNNEIPPPSKRFELRGLVNKYPYFQAGIFIYLKNLYLGKDKTFRVELQRLSTFVIDKKALFYYVLNDEYQKFFKLKGKEKEINRSRTDILLNAFFETMNDTTIDHKIEESEQKPEISYSDYFSLINDKNEKYQRKTAESHKPMKHQNVIDDFIKNSGENESMKLSYEIDESTQKSSIKSIDKSDEELNEELQDDLFFTETLASIYIKQQKYERAYEIIKRLSLNYPEKNVYFASQIAFLEKLIINKKHKK